MEHKIRLRHGVVVKDAMEKSIVVSCESYVKHSKYKKFIKKTTKIMTHDENNQAKVGDNVSITEVKPISKRKVWNLVEIINKAKD